jgi:hypothetical protein
MRVIRVPLALLALLSTSACVVFPSSSGYVYEERHHYYEGDARPAPNPTPGRVVVSVPDQKPTPRPCDGYGENGEPTDPWEETPCAPAKARLILEEDFEDGLGQWKTCAPWDEGFSWKTDDGHKGQAAVLSNEDACIPEETQLGASWLMTKKPIDLRSAKKPKLRLHLKGGDAVQFRLVWAVSGGKFAEERVIAAPFSTDDAWVQKEFDLSALKKTQGQLMVVVKVDNPDNRFDGPMVDSVALYDEQP